MQHHCTYSDASVELEEAASEVLGLRGGPPSLHRRSTTVQKIKRPSKKVKRRVYVRMEKTLGEPRRGRGKESEQRRREQKEMAVGGVAVSNVCRSRVLLHVVVKAQ